MAHRSPYEIIADMLEAAGSEQGAIPTRIMYGALLSTDQCRRYTDLLLARDLLAYDESENVFRITEKGQRYLTRYQEMVGLYGDSLVRPPSSFGRSKNDRNNNNNSNIPAWSV